MPGDFNLEPAAFERVLGAEWRFAYARGSPKPGGGFHWASCAARARSGVRRLGQLPCVLRWGPNELSDAHVGLAVEISLPKQEWTKYQDDNGRLWFWNEEDGRFVVPGRQDCTWTQYADDAGRRCWLHDAGQDWFWEL